MKKKYGFIPKIRVQLQGELWGGGWGKMELEFDCVHSENLTEIGRIIAKHLSNFQPGGGIAFGELVMNMLVFVPVPNTTTWVTHRRVTRWFDIRKFQSLSYLMLNENDIQEMDEY